MLYLLHRSGTKTRLYISSVFGIMPYRRGHSDAVNIDANQMDASKIDATVYQKRNERFLFL